MKHRRPRIIGVAAIVLAGLASVVVYPELPARMATHWGASGEVDGTMSRLAGAFFLPVFTIGVYVVLLVAPRLDPNDQNIESFRDAYEWFAAGIVWFLGYVHGLTLLWNLGVQPPIGAALAPGLAAMLYTSGLLVEHAEPNWIAGVRTPWTLDDEGVWERTNHRAALALKLAGVLALGGLVFPGAGFVFFLVPLAVAVVYVTIYSYVVYRRQRAT
ncbi:SdpI family protein [Halococcus saccharolyticus]|uniref:DUF1648 domain-containing protein n=1 Tax=Halococcus saccharolyticus DSM 5350 TaxID=1227455 RepID=M0MIM7_9EURY|nr:DUF1648 domain-containing protein [Halococcus saccharolyticus]EMA45218.1 hypothetical protein C449_08022 [Halococcus saccharolyticus DSM 5350]